MLASVVAPAFGADVAPVATIIGSGLALASHFVPSGVLGANTYSDTTLQAARAFIKADNNKKFNLKPTLSNILPVFMKGREFTIPELNKIRSADTQTTSALYLKKGSFSTGTSKSCSPSGATAGSGKVDLTWATVNVVVKVSKKQHFGNQVGVDMALANNLYNAEQALWLELDTTLLAYLEANKSGVNLGGSAAFDGNSFDSVHDIMPIEQAHKSTFYNLVQADMMKNNYNPTYLHVHDTMWLADRNYYGAQGPANSTNTAFQFTGIEDYASNLITPGLIGGTTYESLHYFVPEGGVVLLDWNDPLNRAGEKQGDKAWFTMQSILRPEFTFDVFKTTACADTTADGGSTQDAVDTYEISLNYAIAKQPIETANETPIFKYGVCGSGGFVS